MERERRNGAKNRNGPALFAAAFLQTAQAAYPNSSLTQRVGKLFPTLLVARCRVSSDPRDITTRKEEARYDGRGRKRGREKDMQPEHLHFLPSCNFYDSRKATIFTGSARVDPISLFNLFTRPFALSFFLVVFIFFFFVRYTRLVNSCFFRRCKLTYNCLLLQLLQYCIT